MSQYFSTYNEISSSRIEEFFSRGFKKRHFFAHNIYYLPKPGPDGLRIFCRIFGKINPSDIYQVNINAQEFLLKDLPDNLFFDDDIIWHQQQYGKKGHAAVASVMIYNNNLYTITHFSDIYQRISRRRSEKTYIEKIFKGWPIILLNGILNFAREKKLENVFTPASGLAFEHTDKNRYVQKDIFERIYDQSVKRFYKAEKVNSWWKINLKENSDKILIPVKKCEEIRKEKTICLAHDVEAGLGHIGIDQDLVESADKNHKSYLMEMLEAERDFEIPVTYNVVGSMLENVRMETNKYLKAEQHSFAFHSYNHILNEEQILKCRNVDYRIKGYRPPQSKITNELTDENLTFHNFEWLGSSVSSLKTDKPLLENGLVKIPIKFDDFSMYKDKVSYEDWERRALSIIEKSDFTAFCLHDCYAGYWLPHYKKFLNKISGMGKFKTLNQVAEEEILCHTL